MEPPLKIKMTIRLTESERDQLKKYAESLGRTQTELIREFIRKLPSLR